MKTLLIPLGMLALLATACSSKVESQASSSVPSAVPPTSKTDSVASPKVTTLVANTDTTKSSDETKASNPSPTAPKEDTAKLYRINKNYDVVPLEATGNKKVVLLTFDDGPKKLEWIQSLIDTLDKHHAKAIFFEIGSSAKAHQNLLKYTFEHGEAIGNHTWNHSDLKKLKPDQVDDEINKAQEIIKQIIGTAPTFFRPPNGDATEHVHTVVSNAGMTFMNWSDGSLDWDPKNNGKPDAIIENVMKQLHPGSNILMHELPTTVQALDKLLSQIEGKGYSFVDPSTIQFEPYKP